MQLMCMGHDLGTGQLNCLDKSTPLVVMVIVVAHNILINNNKKKNGKFVQIKWIALCP